MRPTGARWGGWAGALIWGAFAATAVYWGLKLLDRSTPVPMHAQVVGLDQVLQGDAARLFASRKRESAAPAPSAGSRFKLHGLLASAQGTAGGVASLSVDGGPPRAYRQGDAVDGSWVVQSISQRSVQLGPRDGPAAAVLEASALPTAATGALGAGPAVVQAAGGIDRVGNGAPTAETASPPPPDQSAGQPPNQAPIMMDPPAAGPAAGRARAVGGPAASAGSAAAIPSSQR